MARPYFKLDPIFFTFLFVVSLHPDILEVEAKDNCIFISFNIDMDTSSGDFSKIRIFPPISGFCLWKNPRELVFVSDTILSDTTIYILSLPSGLRDNNGFAIADTDLVFTVEKSISYTCYKVPFEWEGTNGADVEIDLKGGQAVYTLKPRIHPSYKKIMRVFLCWSHTYRGHLKQDHKNYRYPKFVSSEGKKYKAALDSNGFLYLFDNMFGMMYHWWNFPAKQYYRDLDVSDQGEVLIAFSPEGCDSIIMVYLISPTGDVIWTERCFRRDGMDIEIKFINKLDKFLVRLNKEIYCYKIFREQN